MADTLLSEADKKEELSRVYARRLPPSLATSPGSPTMIAMASTFGLALVVPCVLQSTCS